jgi:hypothetical protein
MRSCGRGVVRVVVVVVAFSTGGVCMCTRIDASMSTGETSSISEREKKKGDDEHRGTSPRKKKVERLTIPRVFIPPRLEAHVLVPIWQSSYCPLDDAMSRVLDAIRKLVPPLDGSLHKGQSGRVAVLGGARDYTGAPFFAAIAALRLVRHVLSAAIANRATSGCRSLTRHLLADSSTRDQIIFTRSHRPSRARRARVRLLSFSVSILTLP